MEASDIVTSILSFGYLGLFCVAFAEKFIPIVPSYVLLMLIGMTASNSGDLLLIIAITSLGSLTASLGWYGIGRWLGEKRVRSAVARFGKYVLFKLGTYDHLAAAYRRNRFFVTLFGQVVPVARIYLALPAGVFALPARTFATAAGIGIAIWNAPFLILGYALHETAYDPLQLGFRISIALIATELMVLAIARQYSRRKKDRASRSSISKAMPTNSTR